MPLDFIATTPVQLHKLSRSQYALFMMFLKNTDFDNWIYIYQKSMRDGIVFRSINYQNALRACRRELKRKTKPVSTARWWLSVRADWRKRGISYNLNKEINFYE